MFEYPLTLTLGQTTQVSGGQLVRLPEEYQFRIRSISRAEYSRWRAEAGGTTGAAAIRLEERVLQHAVLAHPAEFRGEPWVWDQVYAGLAGQVLERILTLSGFGTAPDPALIERVQTYLGSDEARYDLLLMTAFNYTLAELMALDSESWHRLVGLAEGKLQFMGLDPQQILKAPAKQGPQEVRLPAGAPVAGQSGFRRGYASGAQERRDVVEGAYSFTRA